MDKELKLWLQATRRLPRLRGSGRLAGYIQRFYNRKPRERVRVPVLDFTMELDPSECVDGALLFAPQLYDRREFELLKSLIRPGDLFLDAGANIGIYSLVASRLVGPAGKVIAIEASAENFLFLLRNCELSEARNVHGVQVGLSDKRETLRMACSFYGNRSGNSFLKESPIGESVECRSLLEVLEAEGVQRIGGAKFDIEGFEFKVLSAFLKTAPRSLWPRFL
ncbi:MAG TPA: FkbM family methyltransferase, partial [Candidatus Acidoferrum sp.]|nr:FkbM family methyltransferase [Candidatus Acidoferrum sp.]